MKYDKPLIKATLIKRYKRFLADITLEDGTEVTAHCPNTGSMKTCGAPGDTVYLSHHDNPKRKLKYTWELTKTTGGFIGINTHRPNQIIKEALLEKKIPELSCYSKVTPEKKTGTSRIDFFLESETDETPCWVEVKNVTLFDNNQLLFPDAVSERALKHVKTLEEKVSLGERAILFFLANRPEGETFSPAKEIHPAYASALREAQKKGVEVLCYRSLNSPESCALGSQLPISL